MEVQSRYGLRGDALFAGGAFKFSVLGSFGWYFHRAYGGGISFLCARKKDSGRNRGRACLRTVSPLCGDTVVYHEYQAVCGQKRRGGKKAADFFWKYLCGGYGDQQYGGCVLRL